LDFAKKPHGTHLERFGQFKKKGGKRQRESVTQVMNNMHNNGEKQQRKINTQILGHSSMARRLQKNKNTIESYSLIVANAAETFSAIATESVSYLPRPCALTSAHIIF
jgi:hypothetical protein